MKTHEICAMRDSAMQAYGQPIFVKHTAQATRSFNDEINRAALDNQMYQHPEDFELWHLATYDENTGTFGVPDNGPTCLVRGKDVAKRNEQ